MRRLSTGRDGYASLKLMRRGRAPLRITFRAGAATATTWARPAARSVERYPRAAFEIVGLPVPPEGPARSIARGPGLRLRRRRARLEQYEDARASAINDARTRVLLTAGILDPHFGGQITALTAIAQAPPVRARDEAAMAAYFRRVAGAGGAPFAGGLGWADASGTLRVSTTASVSTALGRGSLLLPAGDEDGLALVSEGVTARATHRNAIIMAVATHDRPGRISGVLGGVTAHRRLRRQPQLPRSGLQRFAVLDRNGREC